MVYPFVGGQRLVSQSCPTNPDPVTLADTKLNTFVATVGNMAERATTPNQAVPAAWMWRLKQPERDGSTLQPGTASTVSPLPCGLLPVPDGQTVCHAAPGMRVPLRVRVSVSTVSVQGLHICTALPCSPQHPQLDSPVSSMLERPAGH